MDCSVLVLLCRSCAVCFAKQELNFVGLLCFIYDLILLVIASTLQGPRQPYESIGLDHDTGLEALSKAIAGVWGYRV